MKRVILSAVLFLALATPAFAGGVNGNNGLGNQCQGNSCGGLTGHGGGGSSNSGSSTGHGVSKATKLLHFGVYVLAAYVIYVLAKNGKNGDHRGDVDSFDGSGFVPDQL